MGDLHHITSVSGKQISRYNLLILEAIAKRHERRQDKAKLDEKAEHMVYIRAF